MSTELSNLILTLKKYNLNQRPASLNFILHYKQFIDALENINSLIGLNDVKHRVYLQVVSFIVNYRRNGIPIQTEKLNILLCGPSGCGKSRVGYYLAQLWGASGCIKNNNGKDIFDIADSKDTGPITIQKDPMTAELKYHLSLREMQIVHMNLRLSKLDETLHEVLTHLNNVRKKITAKDERDEPRVQAKLQTIKNMIKTCILPETPAKTILPISIPSQPGRPNTFENIAPGTFMSQPPALTPIPFPSIASYIPVKFVVITKGDLVGKYQGHTEEKVRKLLNKYIGGVIMIDEAYSLCTGTGDDYGKVVLAEIVNFMTVHPGKIVFIFAGYRDQMNTIFSVQEGLSRRIEFVVDIEEYTFSELARIFMSQLSELELHVSPELAIQITEFFKNKKAKFPHFGGDTEKLAKCVKQVLYSDDKKLQDALNDEITKEQFEQSFLNLDISMIEKAYKLYIQNTTENMYSKINEREMEKLTYYN